MPAEMIAEIVASGALASLLDSFAAVLSIVYGGAVLLTLALALALRFAGAPLLEAVARARRVGTGHTSGHANGASTLEAELEELRRAVAALADGLEFDRQLSRGRGHAPPVSPRNFSTP
jgi:hypothetical protein